MVKPLAPPLALAASNWEWMALCCAGNSSVEGSTTSGRSVQGCWLSRCRKRTKPARGEAAQEVSCVESESGDKRVVWCSFILVFVYPGKTLVVFAKSCTVLRESPHEATVQHLQLPVAIGRKLLQQVLHLWFATAHPN